MVEGRSHLNWAALLGGTGTSLGIWILLTVLGFAIGLIAISPQSPNLKGVLIWLGVWAGIVPVIATGVGSLIAAWAANTVRAGTGVLYGFAVWGLSLAVGVLFSVQLMAGFAERSLLASAQVATGAVSATVSGVTGLAGAAPGGNTLQGIASFLNIDRSDLLAPINRRLEADGVPPVTAPQLKAAMQDVANTALQQGKLSQETIVAALTAHTQMTRDEAQRVAQQVEQQWNQGTGGAASAVGQAWNSAGNAVLSGLHSMGGGMWWMFGSFGVSLLGSIGAGVLGSHIYRPRRREVVRETGRAPVTVRPRSEQPA